MWLSPLKVSNRYAIYRHETVSIPVNVIWFLLQGGKNWSFWLYIKIKHQKRCCLPQFMTKNCLLTRVTRQKLTDFCMWTTEQCLVARNNWKWYPKVEKGHCLLCASPSGYKHSAAAKQRKVMVDDHNLEQSGRVKEKNRKNCWGYWLPSVKAGVITCWQTLILRHLIKLCFFHFTYVEGLINWLKRNLQTFKHSWVLKGTS